MKVWRIEIVNYQLDGTSYTSKKKFYPTERGFKNNLKHHKKMTEWFSSMSRYTLGRVLTAYDPDDNVIEVFDPNKVLSKS